MEAEYIAASEAAKESVWIRKFITGLGMVPSITDPVDLYCDNNGSITQAKEPRSLSRAKHILRRYHLLREINERGDIHICKVHTDDNVADPLSKALSQQNHEDGDIDVIETYVFWNVHEPSPGNYNFEGRYDLVRFLKTVQKAGLYANLRVGPYVCSEWNFGGFPVWLKYVPGISFRTDNEPFKGAITKRMTTIEEMVGMDVLCSDKTGTLMLNKLIIDKNLIEVFAKGIDADAVVLVAARASRTENQDAIDTAIVGMLANPKEAHIYSAKGGDCSAFLSNYDSKSVARVLFNDKHYNLPPWSISILPDFHNIVFNTAKVGVQTSKMEMLPSNIDINSWETYNEDISSMEDSYAFTTSGLLEQINVTRDASDYLWCITR
ncbi:hypothetical protein AgCh_021068 [Apium graveolens]